MQVTLRKASALAASLLAAGRAVTLNKSITVSIYASPNIANLIHDGKINLTAAIAEGQALIEAAFVVRGLIGTANASNGVDALLTEKAALDAVEKFLSALGKSDPFVDGDVAEVATAQARFDALVLRAAAVTDRYSREESLTINVSDSSVTAPVSDKLADIRRRKVAIQDALLDANITTKVSLPEPVVTLLTKHKLV